MCSIVHRTTVSIPQTTLAASVLLCSDSSIPVYVTHQLLYLPCPQSLLLFFVNCRKAGRVSDIYRKQEACMILISWEGLGS